MKQSSSEPDFEQQLQTAEQSLQDLKARYAQVQQDQQQQQVLRDRLRQIQQGPPEAVLKTEVRQLQQQLEELEIALESRLFSWKALINPFWQTVRFVGLGLVLGWILKGCSG